MGGSRDIIPTLRLRQEDPKFEINLRSYTSRPLSKSNNHHRTEKSRGKHWNAILFWSWLVRWESHSDIFSCRMLKVYMCIVLSLSLTAEADPYRCASLSPKPWYCFESVEVFKSLCPGCGAMPCNLGTVLQLLVSLLHLQMCPFLPGHCLKQ